MWALVSSLATFVASLGLLAWFDRNAAGEQFLIDVPWIGTPNIHFAISVNGVSLWLILLSTFLTPLCVLISWNSIKDRCKEFYAFLLLLEFGLVGVFLAQDLFLFYVFWEVSLVPMYFLIGIWGHDRRIYAAVKFFLYTMAGSVLMLVAIIYIYNKTLTFSYPAILEMLANGRSELPAGRADAALPRLLHRLRHQGAALPAAHLAARRARGSAHRRLHHAGRRHAENGHLRYPALLPAALPERRARLRARGSACSPSSASSTVRWSRWSSPI